MQYLSVCRFFYQNVHRRIQDLGEIFRISFLSVNRTVGSPLVFRCKNPESM